MVSLLRRITLYRLRRSLLKHALPIPGCEFYHDWWLTVVAACHGGVRYLPDCLVKYRRHDANVTGAYARPGLFDRLSASLRGVNRGADRIFHEMLRQRAATYFLLRHWLALGESDIRYLNDIGRYADSLLNPKFGLTPFSLLSGAAISCFP